MSERVLEPVSGDRLHWIAPPGMSRGEFAQVRQRLTQILSTAQTNEIYAAKRRSIYLVEDADLGRVAIKEMRHESPVRRFSFRYFRYRDAMREYREGTAFQARGGRMPRFLGAALERNLLGLKRVLLFICWLDGVETLTGYLTRLGGRAEPETLQGLAQMLVESARLGLVHGRHSSENILVDASSVPPEFYTIDFAYSRLHEGFQESGFVRDVARIAHWLWHEQVCDDAELERFFVAVSDRAWSDPKERVLQLARINEEWERWKVVLDKSAL